MTNLTHAPVKRPRPLTPKPLEDRLTDLEDRLTDLKKRAERIEEKLGQVLGVQRYAALTLDECLRDIER